MPRRYTDLDGMRGILALIVMIFHLGLTTVVMTASGGAIKLGAWELCVDFFFLMSGFVLAHSFDRELPGIAPYFLRRLLRLGPVCAVATGLMLLLGSDLSHPGIVAANFAMVQSVVGLPSINHPSWSVSLELFVPALAILLWPTLAKRPAAGLSLCLLLAMAATLSLVIGTDLQILRAIAGIGAGTCLYLVGKRRGSTRDRPVLTLVLFFGCLAIMLLGRELPLLALGFSPLAAMTVWIGSQSKTILSQQPFRALGNWSYCIYLLHIPVLTAAWNLGLPVEGGIAVKIGIVLVTVALSYGLHVLCERPFMSIAVSSRRSRPVGSATK
jgi:peptidoglycan/LPS O-acetylase OafA/YrhL